jgi:hypothetical protein
MATQKINMNSPLLRSRVKKYDTYHNRNGSTVRQSVTGVNPVAIKSAVPTVPSHKSTSQINLTPVQTQRISTASPQQLAHSKLKQPTIVKLHHNNQLKSNTHIQNKNKFAHPQHLKSSKKVALLAVAAAQLYDNETYPDNETTLYGIAKKKLSKTQKLLYGFASAILVFSAFVSVQSFITNNQAKEQIATLGENVSRDEFGVSEGTGSEPSEEEVSQSAIANYRVADPRDPKYLRIPELGILARVKNLGVTSDGAVDAPKNIYDTGWYNGSARPGSSVGSSLIMGHVSGWTGPGIFKKIDRMVEGSQFEVEKGNGEIVRYRVTRTEKLPLDQVDMSKILSTEVAGKHDIKLMTCSGRYNSQTKTFEERFVVYAMQI